MTSCHIPALIINHPKFPQSKAEDNMLPADCRVHHVALAGGTHQLCRPLWHGHECPAALLRGCGFRSADECGGEPQQDPKGSGKNPGQSHSHGSLRRDQAEW